MIMVSDGNGGPPSIFPRQIDAVECANLEAAAEHYKAQADEQVATVSPLPGGGHATALFIVNSPKAMIRHYGFTPDYPSQDQVSELMTAENMASEHAFAEALDRSRLFVRIKVVQSDTPSADGLDDFQYRIWLDDRIDGKPGTKPSTGWVIANAKGERRQVPLAKEFGNKLAGLQEMVAGVKTATETIPAE